MEQLNLVCIYGTSIDTEINRKPQNWYVVKESLISQSFLLQKKTSSLLHVHYMKMDD